MPRSALVAHEMMECIENRVQQVAQLHHLSPRKIKYFLQSYTLTEIELGKWQNGHFIPCSGYLSKRNFRFYSFFQVSKK